MKLSSYDAGIKIYTQSKELRFMSPLLYDGDQDKRGLPEMRLQSNCPVEPLSNRKRLYNDASKKIVSKINDL